MRLHPSRTDAVGLALAVLAGAVGLVLWPRLPAEVAVHFSASGTPDNYVPKAAAVVLVPAVMAVTLGVVRLAERADPTADPRTVAVVVVATMALLAALHLLVLAWNLGHAVPFDLVLGGVLAWAALVVGYAVGRERGLVGA